jgi:uncharacterized membrane protein
VITLFTTIELVRNELSRIGPFWWMLWNAGLALIPVGLAVLFLRRSDQPKRIGPVLFFLQILPIVLFLPNAPYVATDLIHFLNKVRGTEISMWHLLATDFPLYVAFVLLGLTSYAFTTDRLIYAFRRRFGATAARVCLVAIPLLSAIGVYLGRVARFNSWDILQDPLTIARSGRNALLDSRMATIILSMTVLLFIVHQFYRLLHDGARVRFMQYRTRAAARVRSGRRGKVPLPQDPAVEVGINTGEPAG